MASFEEQTFTSFEDFSSKFNKFKEENFVVFRTKSSEKVGTANAKTIQKIDPKFVYSRVQYVCTHFGQPRSRGAGVKSKTKHSATGCKASFVLRYDYYEKVLRLTKVNMDHNHLTNSETYAQEYQVKRLGQQERQSLKEIVELNPRNENLRAMVNSKFRKTYTLTEIRRLKHQYKFSVSLTRPLGALKSCPKPSIMSQAKMSRDGNLGKSEHIGIKEVARQKWLALNIITYKDPKGQERIWESVSRTTKQSDEADAVGMIAVFHDPLQDCKCVILIRQYRPPMKAYTIEFPAGLIDKGETPAQAAIREMKEETGYDVTVSHVSSATALDPGVGSSTLKLVRCEVDTSTLGTEYPKPTGGDGDEFVSVIVQPLGSLHTKLQELTESGHVIDSRVYTWAMAFGTV